MEIQKVKTKLLQRRIRVPQNRLLFSLILSFIYSCQHKDQNAERNNTYRNIVERDTTINSIKLKDRVYYKFNKSLNGRVVQAEEYIVNDKLAFRIFFSEYGTNWQNIEIKDYTLFKKIIPTYKNRLGFDLYMSNCSNCHKSYPSSEDTSICNLFNKIENFTRLETFLKQEVIADSINTIYHPSFEFLDSFEISQIYEFLDISCSPNKQILPR